MSNKRWHPDGNPCINLPVPIAVVPMHLLQAVQDEEGRRWNVYIGPKRFSLRRRDQGGSGCGPAPPPILTKKARRLKALEEKFRP